jgi:hypothetical protein
MGVHLLRSREPGRLDTLVSFVCAEPGWEGFVAPREPAQRRSGQPIISILHLESLVPLNTGNQSPLVPHLVEDGLSILQYADDTILLLDDDLEKAKNLKL